MPGGFQVISCDKEVYEKVRKVAKVVSPNPQNVCRPTYRCLSAWAYQLAKGEFKLPIGGQILRVWIW
ncbi:hypothetical protein HBI56_028480 [Parastagonospora nodorum]|uniref:Uncharacterized protein n=1 Tax=Phaeosphaeria nodorum (strain SN15 / ATCC MYA-4574 / FGSC 10173) TaxID=321614 RepID=A0A7U2F034_PHANO|nr:hypothetical protein HBH56_016130 [Parastagonospora nodorum]QRC95073.1 hypothetical protein JI435_301930 [Parastagonospora nodorum SN15]KAH3936821.1 hypothetical protein HBH54_018320 [Parastagonospora nodorum]KAH3953780.1 hypothetical protein HBH53_030710 [Parastagonospora nodorum]KAH3969380.1 hypothetical protein HBH51_122880 [Parastagonospora nodorum]